MIDPRELISALDCSLAQNGRAITLRRRIGTSDAFAAIVAKARVRGFKPEEISGSVAQNDRKVIVSPSDVLDASGWPGAAGGERMLRRGDQAIIDGRPCEILAANPIYGGEAIVRIELQVKG